MGRLKRQADGRPPTPWQGGSRQRAVDRHFENEAGAWRDMYSAADVLGRTLRRRMAITLAFADGLGLAAGAPVLEIGAGAGLVAAALGQRGFVVEAVDPVPAMRDLARQTAARAGVSEYVHVADADARRLPFESDRFDLVIAIGVLPWIAEPRASVCEMARVVRPGGHLIFGVSNQANLPVLLDPPRYAFLGPLRTAVRRLGSRIRNAPPVARTRPMHSFRKPGFDRLLASVDLEVVAGASFGFGPFTVFGQAVFPDRLGLALDAKLEAFGARYPAFSHLLSGHYVVLARKVGR
jgi:SAM-dependent methyltransferase